jgi:uncharacterized protein
MIIKVIVKTRSPNPRIEYLENGKFLVYVSAEPEKNEANTEVISMLSKHFNVHWKNIKIKSGLTSKNKLIEVC